jgi:glutamine amidotransferase-like uncharacterized protein
MGRIPAIASIVLVSIALAACGAGDDKAAILLFDGTGTSSGDVAAVKEILDSSHLAYSTVNSFGLNLASESQLRRHRLLIVPGGNFEAIGKSLTAGTAANIRAAVEGGLNYLGICAGAFFAGNSPYNGLNLTSGVRFGFYGLENRGIRKAPVAIATAEGPSLDQYWEDGPQLSGWGAVVGKYPDGAPAVVEGTFGNGWVILSGVHPEAPERWRRGMRFQTPLSAAHAYAAALIRAAVNREMLPHY